MVRVKAIGLAWHDGRLLAAEVRLSPNSLQGQRVIAFAEDDGTPRIARWFEVAELEGVGGLGPCSNGLKANLEAPR